MKILVLIKRVVDYNARIRVLPDGSGIDMDNVKMSMNPFDEIALEEAIRQKEAGKASEVIAVACGNSKTQETLRVALAMGADRALHIQTEETLQPLAIAHLITALAQQEQVRLVLTGKQTTDNEASQTGAMLAALLGWGQATAISRLELAPDSVKVACEVDDGVMHLALALPVVLTADLRLNEPRYVTLPNMMKAKKKHIDILSPEVLGGIRASSQRVLRVNEVPRRKEVQMLPDMQVLVDKLKNEAGVI